MTVSLAGQTVAELGGARSVLARQRRDHTTLARLMTDYRDAGDGPREQLLDQIRQLVFSHAFAEETVLWPAVRRLLPDGEELTARVETEHQQINELFADIDRLGPLDPEHDSRVERAFQLIDEDIRDEEDELLPRLQAVAGRRRLVRLGRAWEASRLTAPTRPHPGVPRRPPGNVTRGVPLSAYDRTRDLLTPGRDSPMWKAALTAGAAGVAGTVWTARRMLRARRAGR
ncbi:hemerythrin domain-containing protein [Streptomyces lycii]|uniref:Hemerythrin domain-containing protein n=1 Tax=Streptomyces lycii TaxID=2654337 RepID=A0ABQ7FGX6_9ACTN|nr:hemerythrin domain-containing protein [Streptomyces lycii]KAF4407624.1 hemerythrin domain-containing protein [Streptomyces lycii]